jgi:XTP/dITP diphosphohydrolase
MSLLLYACSTNPGKLREFELAALQCRGSDLRIVPLPNLKSIPAPKEAGQTFEENAALKAEYYSGFTDELVLADDSGLTVEALGGAPGVRSARFAGLDATADANNNLLLDRLNVETHRTASFVCVVALARSGALLKSFRGEVSGEILTAPRGASGFGYDPLFFYPPFGRSFGEIDAEEKFSVSHRGHAIRQLVDYLGSAVVKAFSG